MITDLDELDVFPMEDQTPDICICGAGVAGITLALNLSPKLNIVLLEAGGFDYSSISQEVYKGSIVGHDYFDPMTTRLRFLGGTSNHWSGLCRPLDQDDFESKEHVEYSGWPIEHSDLEPYLEDAKSILDIPRNVVQTEEPLVTELNKSNDFSTIDVWYSAPTRFGPKYESLLRDAQNIKCYVNANVTDISLSEGLSRVTDIRIQNYASKTFVITPKKFVLASGGIENPRIMLSCDSQLPEGLGNSFGLVGRFFTEHPHTPIGGFILEDRFKTGEPDTTFVAPTDTFLHKTGLLKFLIRIYRYDPTSRPSFRARVRRILCGTSQGLVRSVFSSECKVDGELRMVSQQAPNFSSRIVLGPERDRFGTRQTAIDWRLQEIDVQTIKQGAVRFGEVFASLGIGRMRVSEWLLPEYPELPWDGEAVAGNHHMCTTRMASSPQNGVVDSNHKVFGIANFYVAGSSVFSTGGHANPTFTIVQMSLRLADHLSTISKL